LKYLLCSDESNTDLKNKLTKRLENKGININLDIDNYQCDKDIDIEVLKFSDFNLRIGYPTSFDIEAGAQVSKFIEVYEPNSLVYIGFATQAYDISFELFKYMNINVKMRHLTVVNDEDDEDQLFDKENFKSIMRLEKVDSNKAPIKVKIKITLI
jgi:hypothetical protein